MLSVKQRMDQEMVGVQPLFLTITAANTPYQLGPTDHFVTAVTALADAAAIITLPSIAEALGRGIYYICAPTGATAGDISVYVKETGAELTTYGDLDADDDHVGLIATPQGWRVILDGVA